MGRDAQDFGKPLMKYSTIVALRFLYICARHTHAHAACHTHAAHTHAHAHATHACRKPERPRRLYS